MPTAWASHFHAFARMRLPSPQANVLTRLSGLTLVRVSVERIRLLDAETHDAQTEIVHDMKGI